MPATYEKIATTTVSGSSTNTITFNSIAASWTDLRIVVVQYDGATGARLNMNFNSDTAGNYSRTMLIGNGTTATSSRATAQTWLFGGGNSGASNIWTTSTNDIFSYAGSTYKTVLTTSSEDANGSGTINQFVQLWRSTSAITRIDLALSTGNFTAGSIATLYGILKA